VIKDGEKVEDEVEENSLDNDMKHSNDILLAQGEYNYLKQTLNLCDCDIILNKSIPLFCEIIPSYLRNIAGEMFLFCR
jgi:hypothetical protein